MPDSDGDYVQSASEDEGAPRIRGGGRNTRTSTARGPAGGFEVSRAWEDVEEGEDGTITAALQGLLEAGRRHRLLKDTTPFQRGIIRHLVVVLDLSAAMAEKDLRPSRHLLTLRYAEEFVTEYLEQNPISQLSFVGMRDGLAKPISAMSGNPADHIARLHALRTQEPSGNASLQNALELARGALFGVPKHSTREVLVVMGSLLSADPGDIHKTIDALAAAAIRCSVIGLAAEVALCRTLVARTQPRGGAARAYAVALDEQHLRELLRAAVTPPPAATHAELLQWGFPSRDPARSAAAPALCACHGRPAARGYRCPRCAALVCELPATCPLCRLTLVLSTHLARSYHHLFPLAGFTPVGWSRAAEEWPVQSACFACQVHFQAPPASSAVREAEETERAKARDGISVSGRYACQSCGRFFCPDCDVFLHEHVHNCPGCLSGIGAPTEDGGGAETVPASNGAMDTVMT